MSAWTRTTVGSIAAPEKGSVTIGPFGSDLKADLYTDGGLRVVRGQDIGDTKILSLDQMPFVSTETADRLASSLAVESDLVFPHRGAIGRVGIVPDESLVLSSSMMRLRCDRSIADPLFVFYYFRGPGRFELLSRASVVGTPGIGQPLTSLRSIPITLPPVSEQRAIAEVLGALDDKIAANRRIADLNRELALSGFDAASSTGAAHSRLGDVLSLEYGRALPATARVPGTVSVFGSGGLVGSHDETWLPAGGVIVGRKGSAGEVYWVPNTYFPIDTTFYVVPGKVPLIFCYYILKRLNLKSLNADSAVPGLNRTEALAQQIAIPQRAILLEQSDRARALFDAAGAHDLESAALGRLRDTLLSELMSGRLRVKDAERQVEDVV